jgi:GNAT superfamily N-acetyltransferase
MLSVKRTDSSDSDFKKLVAELDKELWEIYGEVQAGYAPHNKIETIIPAVVIYDDENPVSCGCFKKFGENAVEVKRMFTLRSYRGKGIASKILTELETWAKEKNYSAIVLETGGRQKAAVHLYQKSGYKVTEKYEPYVDKEESICMRKEL